MCKLSESSYNPRFGFVLCTVLENAQQAGVLVNNDVHHLPPPREVLHKLKKNEDRDAKGARVRKRCRVCSKKGLDRRTVYLCSNCPGNPAFCPSECFGNFHDTLANQGTTWQSNFCISDVFCVRQTGVDVLICFKLIYIVILIRMDYYCWIVKSSNSTNCCCNTWKNVILA